eukprot:Gb_08941 [translate_table: standard]
MRQDQESVGESSSSSALSSQQDIEDDRIIATVLSEEYSKLDGAIGRRLSHLNSIPVGSTVRRKGGRLVNSLVMKLIVAKVLLYLGLLDDEIGWYQIRPIATDAHVCWIACMLCILGNLGAGTRMVSGRIWPFVGDGVWRRQTACICSCGRTDPNRNLTDNMACWFNTRLYMQLQQYTLKEITRLHSEVFVLINVRQWWPLALVKEKALVADVDHLRRNHSHDSASVLHEDQFKISVTVEE